MFSTPTFFNLDLRSLGFIIAITSIFYSVLGICNSGIQLKMGQQTGRVNFWFEDEIFEHIKKNETEQVITEGGVVLSEDVFLDTLSNLIVYASSLGHSVTGVVCPLLLVALIKKKPGLIWPWLIYWAVSLIFNWVICVVVIVHMIIVDTYISAEQMNHTAHQSMAMGLYFALWVAMLSLYEEEKNQNT